MKLEEIDLYVTNRCNLHCDFCSIQSNKTTEDLPLDMIKDIISTSKMYGLKDLHITGGEPTLRDDLEEIIGAAHSADLNIRLITNGTLLSRERLLSMFQYGLKSIMFSLDGLEQGHNSIRGFNAYTKTMNAIEMALELGYEVRVNSVAWKDNLNDILTLASNMNKLGIATYSVFLGSPLGYAHEQKQRVVPPLIWRDFVKMLQYKVNSEHFDTKVVVEKGFLFSDEQYAEYTALCGRGRGCYQLTKFSDYFLIRSNGNVYPCVFYSNEAPAIGNVFSQPFDMILKDFNKNVFYHGVEKIPAACVACNNAKLCKGGCRGYAKLYYNDWNRQDPRCSSSTRDQYFPICPIIKHNINDDKLGGSSEQALMR